MPQKPIALILVSCALFGVLVSPFTAEADVWEDMKKQSEAASTSAGYAVAAKTSVPEIVAKIINVFLGLLGTIFLALMLYAGFLWMTAGGDEEKITKAKKLLGNAVIGLIIVLAAYAITKFVVASLVKATK